MRKIVLVLVALHIAVATSLALPVTRRQAQQSAQKFMALRGNSKSLSLVRQQPRATASQQKDAASYYVFNAAEGQGFVIVSGDDRTAEVLGWSDTGSFDPENIPENMQSWLQGYADQIEWLDTHPSAARQSAPMMASSAHSSVSPMLKTLWDQDAPYNNYTPTYTYGSETRHCATGCVATAMAQLMYYHQWPTGATAVIPGYTKGSYTLPELPATTFDWGNMHTSYSKTDDAPDVAKLMLYCGQSVEMKYGQSSSSNTADVPVMLKKYFGYDKNYRMCNRSDYFYNEWIELIYGELAAARPVLFSGQSTGGGHSFLCDGFAYDDYFHINWGWSGQGNGNFKLSALTPDVQGIGGSSTSDGFNMSQYVVTGIQPDKGDPLTVALTVSSISSEETSLSRTAADKNFSVNVHYGAINYLADTYNFDIGIGLYQGNSLLGAKSLFSYELAYGWGFSNTSATLSFGVGLPDGEYTIKAVSRQNGSSDWIADFNSEQHYITAIIAGNTCTLTPSRVATANHNLKVNSLTFGGPMQQGEPMTVTANITNQGDYYIGDITMAFNNTKAAGVFTEIPAGETRDFTFTYTPTVKGSGIPVDFYMGFFGGTKLASTTVDIASATAVTTDNIDLVLSRQIVNADGSYVIGTAATNRIKVTNNSSDNYKGIIYVYTHNKTTGYIYQKGTQKTIPHNSTIEFDYSTQDFSLGDRCSFWLAWRKNGSVAENTSTKNDIYTLAQGYAQYDADGNKVMRKADEAIAIPAGVAALDLRGQDVVKTVTGVVNPNTIVYADDAATISGVANVVKGGKAETITLTDGYEFCAPEEFTADNISFTTTFANGYMPGGYGWQTVMLPFNVSSVTVGGNPIDWFHSSLDKGKNFWVMEFLDDAGNTIYYTHAAEMKPYVPYLVSVPGDYWGSAASLTGKAITFSGTNATVKANDYATIELNGSAYKFVGIQQSQTKGDIYTLDDNGQYFVKGSSQVKSFHAFLASRSQGDGDGMLGIGFKDASQTSIASPCSSGNTSGVYNLKGQKVDTKAGMPAGIYIINGKKVVK